MKPSANNDYFLFGAGAVKPGALPWRVDKWIPFERDGLVGARLTPMGWYSHKWKADRAVRRAFGGFDLCCVTKVPGDQHAKLWRLS